MTAIETGCPYVISIGGVTATFNVPSDPNFVGYIDDVTGLDMYGVRENASIKSSADGGYHGPFWRDRRPFTLAGFIMPTTPAVLRAMAQNKILGVVGEALRSDAVLTWTPSDNIQRGLTFRTQQPARYVKGQSNVQKRFTIAGVSEDWRIVTWAGSNAYVRGAATPLSVNATNNGNASAAPVFILTGPITNPVITNTTSGKQFAINTTLAEGSSLTVDLTGVYPKITSFGADWSQYVDPLNTNWSIAVIPGSQTFQLNGTGTDASTSLNINWNDSWH